jgi:hypothetical protein
MNVQLAPARSRGNSVRLPQTQQKQSPTPTPTTAPQRKVAVWHDYYRSVNGVCVHRPVQAQNGVAPKGATAQCRDGSLVLGTTLPWLAWTNELNDDANSDFRRECHVLANIITL